MSQCFDVGNDLSTVDYSPSGKIMLIQCSLLRKCVDSSSFNYSATVSLECQTAQAYRWTWGPTQIWAGECIKIRISRPQNEKSIFLPDFILQNKRKTANLKFGLLRFFLCFALKDLQTQVFFRTNFQALNSTVGLSETTGTIHTIQLHSPGGRTGASRSGFWVSIPTIPLQFL